MTRIIAGLARGRRLAVPKGMATRPTSDRAREGLFATVTAIVGPLHGARVLDLYAGSGAVGLEALSRGAAQALFVESDPRAAQVIQANMAAVGLPGGELVPCQVQRFLGRGPGTGGGFDLVVADPPYAAPSGRGQRDADRPGRGGDGWRRGRWSRSSGPPGRDRSEWPPRYRADRSRQYGETTFWYGRRSRSVVSGRA